MKHYIETLTKCTLFSNFKEEEILHILKCLKSNINNYNEENYIISYEEKVDKIYIVLEGTLDLIKENYNGNRFLINTLTPASIFGEGIVCTKERISPVSVVARTTSVIMGIPYNSILNLCSNSCSFHTKLIYNMMLLLGEKNYNLNKKLSLLSLNGIQEKLAYYLLEEAKKRNSLEFTLTLNKTQLAEYLNISRPSMSRELTKMKNEGTLHYNKNSFKILDENLLVNKLSK